MAEHNRPSRWRPTPADGTGHALVSRGSDTGKVYPVSSLDQKKGNEDEIQSTQSLSPHASCCVELEIDDDGIKCWVNGMQRENVATGGVHRFCVPAALDTADGDTGAVRQFFFAVQPTTVLIRTAPGAVALQRCYATLQQDVVQHRGADVSLDVRESTTFAGSTPGGSEATTEHMSHGALHTLHIPTRFAVPRTHTRHHPPATASDAGHAGADLVEIDPRPPSGCAGAVVPTPIAIDATVLRRMLDESKYMVRNGTAVLDYVHALDLEFALQTYPTVMERPVGLAELLLGCAAGRGEGVDGPPCASTADMRERVVSRISSDSLAEARSSVRKEMGRWALERMPNHTKMALEAGGKGENRGPLDEIRVAMYEHLTVHVHRSGERAATSSTPVCTVLPSRKCLTQQSTVASMLSTKAADDAAAMLRRLLPLESRESDAKAAGISAGDRRMHMHLVWLDEKVRADKSTSVTEAATGSGIDMRVLGGLCAFLGILHSVLVGHADFPAADALAVDQCHQFVRDELVPYLAVLNDAEQMREKAQAAAETAAASQRDAEEIATLPFLPALGVRAPAAPDQDSQVTNQITSEGSGESSTSGNAPSGSMMFVVPWHAASAECAAVGRLTAERARRARETELHLMLPRPTSDASGVLRYDHLLRCRHLVKDPSSPTELLDALHKSLSVNVHTPISGMKSGTSSSDTLQRKSLLFNAAQALTDARTNFYGKGSGEWDALLDSMNERLLAAYDESDEKQLQAAAEAAQLIETMLRAAMPCRPPSGYLRQPVEPPSLVSGHGLERFPFRLDEAVHEQKELGLDVLSADSNAVRFAAAAADRARQSRPGHAPPDVFAAAKLDREDGVAWEAMHAFARVYVLESHWADDMLAHEHRWHNEQQQQIERGKVLPRTVALVREAAALLLSMHGTASATFPCDDPSTYCTPAGATARMLLESCGAWQMAVRLVRHSGPVGTVPFASDERLQRAVGPDMWSKRSAAAVRRFVACLRSLCSAAVGACHPCRWPLVRLQQTEPNQPSQQGWLVERVKNMQIQASESSTAEARAAKQSTAEAMEARKILREEVRKQLRQLWSSRDVSPESGPEQAWLQSPLRRFRVPVNAKTDRGLDIRTSAVFGHAIVHPDVFGRIFAVAERAAQINTPPHFKVDCTRSVAAVSSIWPYLDEDASARDAGHPLDMHLDRRRRPDVQPDVQPPTAVLRVPLVHWSTQKSTGWEEDERLVTIAYAVERLAHAASCAVAMSTIDTAETVLVRFDMPGCAADTKHLSLCMQLLACACLQHTVHGANREASVLAIPHIKDTGDVPGPGDFPNMKQFAYEAWKSAKMSLDEHWSVLDVISAVMEAAERRVAQQRWGTLFLVVRFVNHLRRRA